MDKLRSLRTNQNPVFKKDLNQVPPPKDFNKFLDKVQDVAKEGQKVVDIISDVIEIKDTLEAIEILDDKEIKKFGTYAGHIIVPEKYVGKKAKVIIKK